MSFYFEFTNKKRLSDERVKNLVKYICHHTDDIIEIGNFAFDMSSLSSKIMLSRCLECERYNGVGNCCQANPYSMTEENRMYLSSIAEDIVKMLPEDQSSNMFNILESGSLYTKSGSVTTKGNKEGNCFFSYKSEDTGLHKCAIHAYCLQNDLNPAQYKPYICSLFPIFAVRTNNDNIIFFCANKETASFSPYYYTLHQYICANCDNVVRVQAGDTKTKYLKSVNRDNVVGDNLLDNYKEAYIEQENVLRFFVGDMVYNSLVSKIKENSNI